MLFKGYDRKCDVAKRSWYRYWQNNVLVGMGAIIMDDSVVGSNSIIAAGAVVTEGTGLAAGTIYAGVPARKLKDISQELISGEIERIANSYIKYAGWYK